MYKIADLNISPGHNLLKDPEKVLPTSQVFFYSLKMRSSFPKTNIRRIENILIKSVWQNTKGNEGQEPTALQLSSCPVHLEYRISKNKLSGHHTE